eukprot:Protomagalhaensia_sp_Gyna_25__1249@NODE_1623_length_1680_cov_336_470445_g1328_i0_p3_GENE_NODE_1623_length_1680_cov_336_470445_g1328_i0NODE_1623_length_1680_cov_336_470445_g1328_i0_p3_ORF_typecomplete_len115_score2_85DsbB/PF02600_16/0_31DsbB/PF02600_16/1e03_NODE_1623_length_1680_cov_336_470445_g1328_i0373717
MISSQPVVPAHLWEPSVVQCTQQLRTEDDDKWLKGLASNVSSCSSTAASQTPSTVTGWSLTRPSLNAASLNEAATGSWRWLTKYWRIWKPFKSMHECNCGSCDDCLLHKVEAAV